jgi:hypothetical protein
VVSQTGNARVALTVPRFFMALALVAATESDIDAVPQFRRSPLRAPRHHRAATAYATLYA